MNTYSSRSNYRFQQSKTPGPSAGLALYIEYKQVLIILLLVLSIFVPMPEANAAYLQHAERSEQAYKENAPLIDSVYKSYLLTDNRYDKETKRKRWDQLSPEQQKRVKQRRDRFEKLPPEQKRRVKQARDRFRNMTPEERKALREKWQKMSPEERRESLKSKTNKNH